jgi:xanthine dehydrogenase YagR molybdenum-binding subunit
MAFAPIQGGSAITATITMAIKEACKGLRKSLLKKAASMKDSPLNGALEKDVVFSEGFVRLTKDPGASVSLQSVIAANGGKPIKCKKFAGPKVLKLKKYSRAVHSVAFVEVEVDEELGVVQVTRALTAVAAGKIINPKTAKSQIIGSMVWGISKALREESIMDHRFGRFMNQNLSEYHIPVHADIHELEVLFVDEHDTVVNDAGIKGVGEVGLVSMPPAIANAVFHATGRRINSFPITLDKVLDI